jgi:DNA ligase 1
MELPKLYKKTSTGAIQEWQIDVHENLLASDGSVVGVITTRHGQVGGKIQMTQDVIRSGKNIGKANFTTAYEQAKLEAQAKHEKQLKKRYVRTIEEAQAGEVDEVIGGGVPVMLAQSFDKHSAKISYPAYLSPKLDGMRLVATIIDGECSLWSRTQKAVKTLPHIQRALEVAFPNGTVTIDGEAYSNQYRDDFNKIMSLIRPDEPVPGHEIIEYHIFDMVADAPFDERLGELQAALLEPPLILVEQRQVYSKDEAFEGMSEFIANGYEGAMIKNTSSPYEHKRSYHIQKLKLMVDDEFKIVGMEEGRGKLQGHIGSFICETETGVRFNAKLKGSTGHLKHLFEHPEEWRGRLLTVQYQNLTPDGVPRFPCGVRVRVDV